MPTMMMRMNLRMHCERAGTVSARGMVTSIKRHLWTRGNFGRALVIGNTLHAHGKKCRDLSMIARRSGVMGVLKSA